MGQDEALLRSAVYAPAYTVTEASRIAKLTPRRTRRWLRGYVYSYLVARGSEARRGRMPPVVRRDQAPGRTYASFLELVDLLFVKRFLEQGVSLQKLRRAFDEVVQRLGEPHFAYEVFFTEGSNVYWEHQDSIIRLLSGGQTAIRRIVEDLYERIEFDPETRIARRYYPLGKRIPVAVDVLVAFGRPAIVGRGITTANVFDLFNGENEDLAATSSWMGITKREARAAIEFERQLA